MGTKLSFNTGVKIYDIDNGSSKPAQLKVNLADSNLYLRFIDMQSYLEGLENEYEKKTADFKGEIDEKGLPTESKQMLELMREIDVKVKDSLNKVFELDNDFDNIFAGVNVMALDQNGNRIISNFLEMLTPIIEEALKVTKQSDDTKVKALVGNREQRRARNTK